MNNHQSLTDSLNESDAPLEKVASPAPARHRRRDFLAGLSGLSALALGGSLWNAKSARADGILAPNTATTGYQFSRPVHRGEAHMLDNLTKEVFEAQLNTSFKARELNATSENETSPVKLELVQVETGRGHDPQNGYESFSLLFRGPSHAPLEQNTYELGHKSLGQPAIFIVPISSDEKGFYYEAVFNRLQRA